MCDCCSGNKNVFTDANIKCNALIEGGELRIHMPDNTVSIPIAYCPMCGEQIEAVSELNNSNTLRENLIRLNGKVKDTTIASDRRTALDVAKHVVNTCIAINHPISNSCLQHVLYELYKAAFRRGLVLFCDDFETSAVGPRISEVYYNFCAYGAMPITMEQKISDNPKKRIPDKFNSLFNIIVCSTANTSLYDWIENAKHSDSQWYNCYVNKITWIPYAALYEESVNTKDVYDGMLKNMQKEGLV